MTRSLTGSANPSQFISSEPFEFIVEDSTAFRITKEHVEVPTLPSDGVLRVDSGVISTDLNIEDRVSTLESDVSDIEHDLIVIGTEITDLNTRVTTNENELEDHETRITALEEEEPIDISPITVQPPTNILVNNSYVGNYSTAGFACFKHKDTPLERGYAIRQNAAGDTFVNCQQGRSLFFTQGNDTRATLFSFANWEFNSSITSLNQVRAIVSVETPQIQNSSGTLEIASNSNVTGTLNVTGNTTLGGTATISGATTINNNATVTGNTTLGGTATISGATTINNNVTVNGTATISGATTINNDATVTGNLTVNSQILGASDLMRFPGNTPGEINRTGIGATTNVDRFIRFRNGGGSPSGFAGIQLSHFDNPNFYIFPTSIGLGFWHNPVNSNIKGAWGTRLMTLNPNGNLGLGLDNPSQRLHVSGSSIITGNLGIGTTSPSQKLDVVGNILATGTIVSGNGLNTITREGSFTSFTVSNNSIITATLAHPPEITIFNKIFSVTVFYLDSSSWFSIDRSDRSDIHFNNSTLFVVGFIPDIDIRNKSYRITYQYLV